MGSLFADIILFIMSVYKIFVCVCVRANVCVLSFWVAERERVRETVCVRLLVVLLLCGTIVVPFIVDIVIGLHIFF